MEKSVFWLLCASLAIATEAHAQDLVSLRFAWPNDLVLRMESLYEIQEIREPEVLLPPTRFRSELTWIGKRTDETYRIAFSDFISIEEELRPTSEDPIVQLFYESSTNEIQNLLPALFIDEDGQPVDLEGISELREKLIARYNSIPGVTGDERARSMVQLLTSEKTIVRRVLEDWNYMVTIWHGADMEIGKTLEIGGIMGDVDGVPLTAVFSYVVERRVECNLDDMQLSCVRLRVSQLPRLEQARPAAQALLGFDIVSELGAPSTAHFEITNTFTIETDPSSLVPSRYEKERKWSVSWVDPAGEYYTIGQINRWIHRFSKVE